MNLATGILNKSGSNKNLLKLIAFFIFLFFACYYSIILYYKISTDIQPHAAIAYSFVVNHDKLTPNFLYFFLVALLSGFTKYYHVYYVASIVLLSGAITAKFLLNNFYLNKYTDLNKNSFFSLALSFIMLFVFALPGLNFILSKDFYLGQLAPNVWHNSTVIFLMPFAVLLFFKSFELLFNPSIIQNRKQLILIAALIIINALIKPSFLFTLLPSVFVFFCYNKFLIKTANSRFSDLLPYIIGISFILVEYYIIYKLNYTSSLSLDDGASKIVVAPFDVWAHFSENIPVAVLTSLFFPITYLIISKGRILKDKMVQFAILNFVIGLIIWSLFAEEGSRKYHGNFFWQVVTATYLLFFSLLIHLVNDIKLKRINSKKQFVIGGVFLLHFIWGAFYWLKIIIFNGYS